MQPRRLAQPAAADFPSYAIEITPARTNRMKANAMARGGVLWRWGAEELVMLPQRALWRPASRQLLVADLHLGKAELFQAHGIPLPSDGDQATFDRLIDLCDRLDPDEVIVLGDLIHGRMGLTPSLHRRLRSLPEACGCAIRLIGGNHDRGSDLEGLPHQPSQRLGALWLSHEPEPQPSSPLLNICGHVHPVARLRQGCDGLRLPCFAFHASEQQLLIPAFGELTGGHECGQRYRKWLVADNAIVPWLDPLSHSPSRRLAR